MTHLFSTRLPILFSALLLATTCTTAHAGYDERAEVQTFIAEMQQRHGLDSDQLTSWFSRATPLAAVLKAIAPPADPRVKSWRTYQKRFIEPRRLKAGLAFWQQHRATLAKAQALSGVPAELIVAIIGIETFYGKHLGRFDSFNALATLAFDYPPRAELFRRELEALLLLARDEGRSPHDYRGSYAAAMGLPQFLPSSIRAYAVDFDGDGQIDLTNNPADAIGSVANFLKQHGWVEGGPITQKVDTDETAGNSKIQTLIDEGILPRRLPAEMGAFGVSIPDTAPAEAAALIDLVTPDAATEYWLGYQNFYVITRYNRSSFYAMTVFQLAAALHQRHTLTTKR